MSWTVESRSDLGTAAPCLTMSPLRRHLIGLPLAKEEHTVPIVGRGLTFVEVRLICVYCAYSIRGTATPGRRRRRSLRSGWMAEFRG